MTKLEYNTLNTLDGLEAIRKRPGMYVGSTMCENNQAPRGLMHLVQEVLSNSADESLSGFGDRIILTLHEDHSVTIQDFGRGIPYGRDGDDVIRGFTVPHTSGKFDSEAYRKSGGTHGIGLKAVTALSKFVEVKAVTQSDRYQLRFEQDQVTEQVVEKNQNNQPTGTMIHFLPDDEVFETIQWDVEKIKHQMDNLAYLTEGVSYELRIPNEDPVIYQHNQGIDDLVKYMVGDGEVIGLDEPVRFKGVYGFKNGQFLGEIDDSFKGDTMDVEVSLEYVETSGDQIRSFVNAIPTTQGGPHENGLKRSLHHVFSDYATVKLGKKASVLDARDVRDGLVAVISMGIPESLLQFEGQTKEKLGTAGADDAIYELIQTHFKAWLYDHDDVGKTWLDKIYDARQARLKSAEARKSARAARKSKSTGLTDRLLLSTKFTDARSDDPEERELFIVEGDSAAGSANRARDSKTQAILPIRGKILNVMGEKASRVMGNMEISTLLNVLGCGFKEHFDEEKLDFHKVIIMTDADDDGSHIAALLITFFWQWMPQMVEGGYLYLANAPLYRFDRYVKGKRELAFALDRDEYEQMLPDYEGWKVTRLKGLGEMNDQDLRVTTMSPDTRQLYRVQVSDAESLSNMIELLMGKERKNGMTAPEARRSWFEQHVTFGTGEF